LAELTFEDIGGVIAKQDDRYIVKDNTTLKNLIVSSTWLEAKKSTTGHAHKGQEEVYFFIKGKGDMEMIDPNGKITHRDVTEGSIVLIPDGHFHRVHNIGDYGLYFICVFDGKRNH
jgi:oxalate decarboxylase/phosphoglucose isomerase-like protein (cupin superfamily)